VLKLGKPKKEEGVLYAIDMLPIKLNNVGFRYTQQVTAHLWAEVSQCEKSRKMKKEKPKSPLQAPVTVKPENQEFPGISNVNLDIEQGRLVALISKRGQGKSTLLKVLGGVLLPDGSMYMPTHLRVLHVHQEPMFFDTTLLENLTYGVPSAGLGNIERVLCICRSLMADDNVVKLIMEKEVHQWNENLSLTQKTSLHLARALIANPDVLMIHKPLLVFDSVTATAVMKCLRRFVDDRGLFMEGDVRCRRRKTCIVSVTRMEGIKVVDKCFSVAKTGVTEVSREAVTNDMMG
jgi:ABC-type multidrug transport system fused ATPase/permease subunit